MAEKAITTFADIKKRKKFATEEVAICMDPQVAKDYEEALLELTKAEARAAAYPGDEDFKTTLVEKQALVDKLYSKVVKESIVFKFRGVSKDKLDDLYTKHQPTEQQKKRALKEDLALDFNPDTLPPALLAMCIVEPQLSEEEIHEMWESDDWSQPELMALFQTALKANASSGIVDLKKG